MESENEKFHFWWKEFYSYNRFNTDGNIDKKSIKTSDTLNKDLLKKLNLISKNSNKLKILGQGEIKTKINIIADLASKSALQKLEKLGGSIQIKK